MNTQQKKMRFRLQIGVAFFAFAVCILSGCGQKIEDPKKLRFAKALLDTSRNPRVCLTPNFEELKLLNLALSAIELGHIQERNALDLGGRALLAEGISRHIKEDIYPVCIPSSLLQRAALVLEKRGGFGINRRLFDYELYLAAKFENPGDAIVFDVAQLAFATTPQQINTFVLEDIRPIARSVLGSYGRAASKYADLAFEQIEADTPMGTGAAQVATAGGHPQALQKVVALINELLNSVSPEKTISVYKRNRLYELAWAIAYAGDSGKPYIGEIHKIMNRRVESLAPPLGALVSHPKQLCKIFKYLRDEEGLNRYEYCTDDSSYDQ